VRDAAWVAAVGWSLGDATGESGLPCAPTSLPLWTVLM
jgi:hypothetical protein